MEVAERWVSLSIVVTGANRYDVTQLAAVLDGCVMTERGYVSHVRSRGAEDEEARSEGAQVGCRGVAFGMNRFRKLAVRFEKNSLSYMAILHLAAGIIALRKVNAI